MNLFVIAGFIGGQEILLILVIVLVLFGGKKIPELMRGLGKGMKEFKNATNEDSDSGEKTKKESGSATDSNLKE